MALSSARRLMARVGSASYLRINNSVVAERSVEELAVFFGAAWRDAGRRKHQRRGSISGAAWHQNAA